MSEELILDGSINERLSKALEASNYRITYNNQRKNAKLKLNRFLSFPKNGGMFFITPDLISFIHTLLFHQKESAILMDTNDNPIEIKNLEEFFEEIFDRYHQGMNDYLSEYKEFQKSRNVSKLIFGDSKK